MDMGSMGGSGGSGGFDMSQLQGLMGGGNNKPKTMQELLAQALGGASSNQQPAPQLETAPVAGQNKFAQALSAMFGAKAAPSQESSMEPIKTEALKNAFAQKKELNKVILAPEDDENKFLS